MRPPLFYTLVLNPIRRWLDGPDPALHLAAHKKQAWGSRSAPKVRSINLLVIRAKQQRVA